MNVLQDFKSGFQSHHNGNVISVGNYSEAIEKTALQLIAQNSIERLYNRDVSLWSDDEPGKREASNRLNWLKVISPDSDVVKQSKALLEQCKQDGYSHTLLIGMGGSSLAPEVYQEIQRNLNPENAKKGLSLSIIDSIDPNQVAAAVNRAPIEKTLFIVSSKSGTTAEGDAIFAFLWRKCELECEGNPGDHFVAITDPGTVLAENGQKRHFRKVFSADPQVGGRFSALIAFGIVPAVLCGIDVATMLKDAKKIALSCANTNLSQNPGAVLAIFLSAGYAEGANKVTIVSDPPVASLGSWLEQLIAESSGKQSKGIVPVDGEPLISDPAKYSRDRLFIYLQSGGKNEVEINRIAAAGFPVLSLEIQKAESLGAFFYMWEAAIALTCSMIRVNAFDQPDVQSAKDATNKNLDYFHNNGKLPEINPVTQNGKFKIYSNRINIDTSKNDFKIYNVIKTSTNLSDFVAINAFLERNKSTAVQLQKIQKIILEASGVPVSCGFGPRYLHSTGQLHKGGKDEGIFIILSVDEVEDIEIPTWNMTFKTLHMAQTIGDFEALKSRDRRVLWVRCRDYSELECLFGI